MSIGQDIKDVLEELGTSLFIYKLPSATVITEKCDHEFFPTHSSEFLRQFFSSATLPFDTQLRSGDLVQVMGTHFLCTGILGSSFENGVVDKIATFYRCNTIGKLSRYRQSAEFGTDYVKERNWVDIYTNVRALQYESPEHQRHSIEEHVVATTVEGTLCFLPGYVVPKLGDRWYHDLDDLTKFTRVVDIDSKRLDNISILILKDDKRE